MTRKYSDCFYCGGAVREKAGTREYHWKGKLYVFEDVPMGICNQCGEKTYERHLYSLPLSAPDFYCPL